MRDAAFEWFSLRYKMYNSFVAMIGSMGLISFLEFQISYYYRTSKTLWAAVGLGLLLLWTVSFIRWRLNLADTKLLWISTSINTLLSILAAYKLVTRQKSPSVNR